MKAVIACGNPNRCDDGAAGEVLRLLRARYSGGETVRLLDAGTDGMAVIYAARGCDEMILVDACCSGSEAGAVFEVPGHELSAPAESVLSTHAFRWQNALYAGVKLFGEAFASRVAVFLIEAESVALGTELSEPVARAVVRVADRIAKRLEGAAPLAMAGTDP